MTIMQGDSYPIFIELTHNKSTLTPDMVEEIEIYVGDTLRKLYSEGGVLFDEASSRWYIHPTQKETLALEEGSLAVTVRIRYSGFNYEDVVGMTVGRITVIDGVSEAVI